GFFWPRRGFRRGCTSGLPDKDGATGVSNAWSSSGGGDDVSSTSDGPAVLPISSSGEVAGARKLTGEIIGGGRRSFGRFVIR
ncbi:hypothetical protein U1Q18_002844, partial [Sarracenia purpurea var. burkii]